ncbi:MAG: response regulator transcription factor [Dehalococcoidales bacterium]|jgi:two-component system KDP operon response regulator KdpE|nr:response regulator transcription factor [Dehalococcoidales bacterium]MDD4466024.1 response regulator transcription factor [Dehalococcoidales bacterium]MDD5402750.1 response regulator transcription factor [Dehalococcoidales bacterium]
MKVLLIEDDRAIIETITLSFQVGWPEAEIISTRLGEEGIEFVETQDPDIVILDLGLPDISGYEVLKRIRLFSNIPIMILTQNEEEQSVIKALELGADEYIIKPFRQLELLARIKSIIRRHYGQDSSMPDKIGPFQFDLARCTVKYKEKVHNLTKTEIAILRHLALNAGKVVTINSLAQSIWDSNYPDSANAIRVYIYHLREKLEPDPRTPSLIVTKAGSGYILNRE